MTFNVTIFRLRTFVRIVHFIMSHIYVKIIVFSDTRVRWTEKEMEELRKYAAQYLQLKKTPSRKVCAAFIKKSRECGGQLHRRSPALIVKKISNMNVKARQQDDD